MAEKTRAMARLLKQNPIPTEGDEGVMDSLAPGTVGIRKRKKGD